MDARKHLKKLLDDKGWSQADAARELQFSEPTVSRWLSGQRIPGREAVVKLWTVLGMDPVLWMSATHAADCDLDEDCSC